MVFLNPLASTLKVWMVFFFVLDILFKSIWAWCDQGHRNSGAWGLWGAGSLRGLRGAQISGEWIYVHKSHFHS